MKKKQAGNTITIVLICLVVITILSLSIVYSVSYTTTYRLRKSQENFNHIMLENESYKVLNDFVFNYDKTKNLEEELQRFKDTYILSAPYKINIMETTADSITFKICYKENRDCILVESRFILTHENDIQEYKITKWGKTTWI